MRATLIRYAAAAIFLAAIFTGAAAARPNIIFILADDLGRGDLGCYGGTVAETPNIDRFAREGTRFTQYYAMSPICSPSRAGLITGMFPGHWQITSFLQARKGNRDCEQNDFLAPAAPALPRALKAAGYATAHIGKWHLGGGRDVTNAPKFAVYGYDEHAGTYESPEPHPDITATNWIWSPRDKVKRWDRTAYFVDRTLDFVKRHKGQPCFVNLWLDDPHTPWVPRDNGPRGENRENLREVLVEMDRQVGRLVEGLRASGLETNTLVIFASDNGALPTFGGARAAGLRGSKLSLYEGGIRVPFIARWPGHVPAGRVDTNSVIAGVDMFPTFCELAGASAPKDAKLNGQSIVAALRGKPIERSGALLWEYGRNTNSFAYPRIQKDRSPNVAIREREWKLLVNANGTSAELYNVVVDEGETQNLASEKPELTRELKERALAWRKSL